MRDRRGPFDPRRSAGRTSLLCAAALAGIAGCSRGAKDPGAANDLSEAADDLAAADLATASADLAAALDLAPDAGGPGPVRAGTYAITASCSSFVENAGMIYYGETIPTQVEAEVVTISGAAPSIRLKSLQSDSVITTPIAADVRSGRVNLTFPADENPRSAFDFPDHNTNRSMTYQFHYGAPRSLRLWHYYEIDGKPYDLCYCSIGLDGIY